MLGRDKEQVARIRNPGLLKCDCPPAWTQDKDKPRV